MNIIQQTSKPVGSGDTPTVKITDSSGGTILASSNQLQTTDTTTQALLVSINTYLQNISGTTVLVDTSRTIVTSGSLNPLPNEVVKKVTLISLSTNSNLLYTVSGGATLTLEPGYSVQLNVANSNAISISQAASGESFNYIVSQ